MRVLREVEGQHERFCSRVLDFHTAVCKCGLSDESDLRIDLAELHIVVISVKVVGFSIVTDMCLPDALEPANIDSILKVAADGGAKLERLISEMFSKLASA